MSEHLTYPPAFGSPEQVARAEHFCACGAALDARTAADDEARAVYDRDVGGFASVVEVRRLRRQGAEVPHTLRVRVNVDLTATSAAYQTALDQSEATYRQAMASAGVALAASLAELA